MKAISLRQLWANLVASGQKTIETRTWGTEYRGPLLIVSSKSPDIPPAGYALAVVDLLDCRQMTKHDETAACCSIYPNAIAWVLGNVRRLRVFPVKGQRRIFEIDVPQLLTPDGDSLMINQ